MHKHLWIISLLVATLCACETDFDPYIPSKPTPVVYGVINPDDSLYQIRLTKSFVGPGSAYDYAQISDSLFFQNAKVYLDTYLDTNPGNDTLLESVELELLEIEPRQEGIFIRQPNLIYQTNFHELNIRPEQYHNQGLAYDIVLQMRAIIPGYADTVTAKTRLKKPPRIVNPKAHYQKVYFFGEIPFQVEWTHTSKDNYFELQVVFHYKEILEDEQREAAVEWVLTGIEYNESSIPGGVNNFYNYYLRPDIFYSHIRATIPVDHEVKARLVRNIDFVILTSDGTIKHYNEIGELADDYHGATYSNLNHGLGIFTSYNTVGVYGLRLGQRELDSLAFGTYTKHLNFKNWE
ncbi:MAG: DUF4249 family protein [Bacteroidales bacterium]|nr:DUF4249 family protein [Bacteroidales bacterium]